MLGKLSPDNFKILGRRTGNRTKRNVTVKGHEAAHVNYCQRKEVHIGNLTMTLNALPVKTLGFPEA